MAIPKNPEWFEDRVFTYPPKGSWNSVKLEAVRKAWRSAGEEDYAPRGLYIEIPCELGFVPRPSPSEGTHPFVTCLKREVEALDVPARLALESVYIGSGGAGTLTHLGADAVLDLLEGLRERFGMDDLRQFIAEVDAAAVTIEIAGLLKGAGVDRVSTNLSRAQTRGREKEAFARGLAYCRDAGIPAIDIDLKGPWKDRGEMGQDVDFALALKPDSVNLPFGSHGDDALEAKLAELGPRGGRNKNLQLSQARELRGAVLGLGPGAVSFVGREMAYAKGGGYVAYLRSLLRGETPRLVGGSISKTSAMRGRIIAGFGEEGFVQRPAFRQAFGENPEEAFPEIFERLSVEGKIVTHGEQLQVASTRKEDRIYCAKLFCEERYRNPAPSIRGGHPAGTPPSPVARELLDAAVKAFGKGDSKGALGSLDRCIETSPDYVDARMTRAAVYTAVKDSEAALRDLDDVIGKLEDLLDQESEPWISGTSLPWRRALFDVLQSRAALWADKGKRDRASADRQQALLISPL